MCGRYTIIRHDQIVRVVFNITVPANLRFVARYNVAPTQLAPVITAESKEVQMFRWGLTPGWAKDEKTRFLLARAETLPEKPAFRQAFARRRCLVPADGFYEWRAHVGAKTKVPMYIRMRSREMFAFAGLWDTWRGPDGKDVSTFAIITTPPNELVSAIHDRMPAILPPEAYADWLDPHITSAAALTRWLKPLASQVMEAHAVGPGVNRPANEGSDLIAFVESPAEAAPPAASPRAGAQPTLFD